MWADVLDREKLTGYAGSFSQTHDGQVRCSSHVRKNLHQKLMTKRVRRQAALVNILRNFATVLRSYQASLRFCLLGQTYIQPCCVAFRAKLPAYFALLVHFPFHTKSDPLKLLSYLSDSLK